MHDCFSWTAQNLVAFKQICLSCPVLSAACSLPLCFCPLQSLQRMPDSCLFTYIGPLCLKIQLKALLPRKPFLTNPMWDRPFLLFSYGPNRHILCYILLCSCFPLQVLLALGVCVWFLMLVVEWWDVVSKGPGFSLTGGSTPFDSCRVCRIP